MRKIRIDLEYDGTNYVGFQRQTKGKTIQSELEKAFSELCQEPITIFGAGRTDSGVHALGQVCHFKTSSKLPLLRLFKGSNKLLPKDIVVSDIQDAADDFHARHSAIKRSYAYFILNRPAPSALFRNYMMWAPYALNDRLMAEAVSYLEGKHDYSSFASAKSSQTRTSITVTKAALFRGTGNLHLPFSALGDYCITFSIEAQSFLYNMVRIIVGTLLEIGQKKRPPSDIKKLLQHPDRKKAGPTAPSKGLFLMKVEYP